MTITPPAGYSAWGAYLSEAEYFKPVHSLLFERREGAPPTQRSRDLVGKVNSLIVGSYAVNTLLFARLDAQSDDGGRTWDVTYEFRYSSSKWVHTDFYKGPSGKPVPGATLVDFDILEEDDFSSLGLDFSDTQTPI